MYNNIHPSAGNLQNASLIEIVNSFRDKKIAVIGDAILDVYWYGDINRISSEAPVPIVEIIEKGVHLGGAANVAMNIRTMGAEAILCTVIGDDTAGDHLINLMKNVGLSVEGIIRSNNRVTTVKNRVISRNHQLLRFDEEIVNNISHEETEQLKKVFFNHLVENKINAVIFQDYNKGVLTEEIIHSSLSVCKNNGILTAVDPKERNFFAYSGATLFKPNLREIKHSLSPEFVVTSDISSLLEASKLLHHKINPKIIMVTLSEKGIFIFDGINSEVFPADVRLVADVSGAGDTVISIATLCLVAQADITTMARLSNLAASLACEKPGIVPVSAEQILSAIGV